jgi:hypothetical protein
MFSTRVDGISEEERHFRKEWDRYKTVCRLPYLISASIAACNPLTQPSHFTPRIQNVKMGAEANTDKPHSHHALPKDIPEDEGLRNKAAPGVCTPSSPHRSRY